MTGRFARLSVAVAAGLSVLVGSCDSSGDPGTLPSGSSSSSGSPSGSASASASPAAVPTPPAAAQKHTSAGASEFVRFYIDLINEAYRTGASEPLRVYADDECNSCSSIADAVDEIYAAGSARGGQITIRQTAATGVSKGVTPAVTADVVTSRLEALDAAGNVIRTSRGREGELLLALRWSDSKWLILSIR
ncbi:MAG: DUF6318 family protein [Actinomycetes bacterium]